MAWGGGLTTSREDVISKIHFRIIIKLPTKQTTKIQKQKNILRAGEMGHQGKVLTMQA